MSDPNSLANLFSQVAALRTQLASAQSQTTDVEVEGSAGQGAVRARVRGEFEFMAVSIDPALVGEADAALVEDLVLAAIRDAVSRLAEARHAALGAAASGAIAGLLGTGSAGSSGAVLDDDPTN